MFGARIAGSPLFAALAFTAVVAAGPAGAARLSYAEALRLSQFLLNFTLYNKEVAERDGPAFVKTGQTAEDCWTGTQQRAVLTASK